MGVGGGFVANIYLQQGRKAYTLNARERAPRHAAVIESTFRTSNGHRNEGTLQFSLILNILNYFILLNRPTLNCRAR